MSDTTPPAISEDQLPVTDEDSARHVEESRAPLMSHLVELRQRLIVMMLAIAAGFILCFVISYPLYNLLVDPFASAVERYDAMDRAVLHYPPLALFFARVKLAFFAGMMIAFPIVAWQTYRFVAPGLYKKEKNAILPFIMAIPVLFMAGILLVHQLILPLVMNFALSMEQPAEAAGVASYELFVRVDDYLNLAMTLMVGFGFAFQLPIILTLLGRAGIISADWLAKNRRFAIVAIFLVAAVLTPPDPISQIALGGTIMVLYEISIIMVRSFAKKDTEADADAPTE